MKKTLIIALKLSLLMLISATAVIYWPLVPSPNIYELAETTTTTIPVPPEPKFRCPLDGEATTEQNSLRRPLAIMIENHVDARPQSSLTKACIVYETVAEGGITRFMAIFLHNDADTVGPVRSAREYYVNLAQQYNALYAHCGGPATIYSYMRRLGVATLDEFANGDAYWRIRGRRAPHNLYTSTENLWKKAVKRKYDTEVFYQKPSFKDDEPLAVRPDTATVDINFSRPAFRVHYEYDRKTNSYKRFMARKPHIDSVSNQQIAPKNIVIQYVSIAHIANDPKGRMKADLIGTGQGIVFQDGVAIQATWQRPSLTDLTRFYDINGNEIEFNRGQTWIELVDPAKMQVNYQ
ncbi:MAG TPA: DUF3048 domain-containing protein [Anaerolineae bacterium]|jgi:hypothetical protein|nr:DUF3048 domain-containing protein [Anaerolineae bacterium]